MNTLNEYQKTLYNDLMNLVETNEAFYFTDQELDGSTYRIFNYRLASYMDFQAPNARECRGTTFRIRDGEAIRLVALPMEKFWNLHENPHTIDLDLSQINQVMLKADGSLISTYMHKGQFRLKTKGSLFSDQALNAMEFLNRPENSRLEWQLKQLTEYGYCINMEWCAPDNRIVIGYLEPKLTILNIRVLDTGEYVKFPDRISIDYDALHENWIEITELNATEEFVKSIPDMQGVEGYVIQIPGDHAKIRTGTDAHWNVDGIQHVKVKTEWYLVQHRAKDSINSPRRLYEAVLEQATDDLRSLFYDDPLVIKMIEEMEIKVDKMYNHLVATVENFYTTNKDLERKDYAILGQKELPRVAFGLAMSKYLDHEVDYVDFMRRNWKKFGIKDEVKESE